MDSFILYSAVIICLLLSIPLYRTIVGPTILDRILGVNAIGTKTTALLIMIGFIFKRVDMFIDIALAYAFLNFIAVIAASRYFYKKKGLDQEGQEESL